MTNEKNTLYKACPGVILTSIGSRCFLVTHASSMELNEIALFFWKRLTDGSSEETLFEAVCEHYEVDESSASMVRNDISAFLTTCLDNGLVTVCGGQ